MKVPGSNPVEIFPLNIQQCFVTEFPHDIEILAFVFLLCKEKYDDIQFQTPCTFYLYFHAHFTAVRKKKPQNKRAFKRPIGTSEEAAIGFAVIGN